MGIGNPWVFHIVLTLLIGSIVYYFGGLLINFAVKVLVNTKGRGWKKADITKRRDTLASLSAGVWRALVVIVVFFTIFRIVLPSADLAPVFASAGILGVAFGFGAQSTVKDFLSGLFIVTENQFRVGDVVELNDKYGTVERIGARSTSMRDMYGNLHYFPNSLIGHTVNLTNQYSLTRFDITIDPHNDIDKAIKIINKVGKDLAADTEWQDKIVDPPSFLRAGDFDALSLVLTISGTANPPHQWGIIGAMKKNLLEEFLRQNIKLSYPIPPGLIQK